jgi:hypothetical protein
MDDACFVTYVRFGIVGTHMSYLSLCGVDHIKYFANVRFVS